MDELDKLLAILRKHDVALYKQGDTVIQLNPKLPEFDEPEVAPNAIAGGWKRSADLTD